MPMRTSAKSSPTTRAFPPNNSSCGNSLVPNVPESGGVLPKIPTKTRDGLGGLNPWGEVSRLHSQIGLDVIN
jgi:hypothetical protein